MYFNYGKDILAILIIVLLLPVMTDAQISDLKFQRISKENGLSTSAPTAVIKDSRGFIWIASQSGLNRFDGTGFKIFTHDIRNPKSISDDYIMCICEDSDGNIWAGTISNGLNRFNRQTEKFDVFLNDPANENSLSSNNIRALAFDDGKLWIGTQHGGLNLLDIKTGKFTRFKHNPNNPLSISNDFIWTLLKDREGNIWIGTNGDGLDKFDKRNNTFLHYRHNQDDAESISHNEVRTIYEDEKGNIWVGTNGNGLNLLNKSTGKFRRIIYSPDKKIDIQNNVVLGIARDGDNILIGEYFNGLSIYNTVTNQYRNFRYDKEDNTVIPFNGVYAIYKDARGIIWICHEGKGLFVYDNDKYKFRHYNHVPDNPNSLCEDIVWTFKEDNKGNIWISTKNGLSEFDPVKKSFRNYFHNPADNNSLSDNSVGYICKDKSDYLWVGTSAGALDRIDLATGKWSHFYSHPGDTSKRFANIVGMVEDNDGQLWMGTYSDGLKMFNKDRTVVTSFTHNGDDPNSISSNGIWSLSLDNDDNLWIGTYTTGADKRDKKTGKFTNYRNNPQDSNSLSANIVTHIYQDREGIYWLGTYGGGLNRFDMKENKFRHYTTNDGLPDNVIYGILEDSLGRFWMSTNQGITKFNPKTGKFVSYNTGDGLQSQEFNQNSFFISKSGEFYFGGVNGFNVFRPADFAETNTFQPLVLTSLKIYNKEAELPVSITETKEIELSYRDNFFSLEYAVLEFTNPTKIEYAYKLEGVDKKWNYVKNSRTAHYTNVSPGDYVFKVKSTNVDGLWNEEFKTLKVSIIPPWWQSSWLKGLTIVLFAGIILSVMIKRNRSIKKDKMMQREFTRLLIDSHEQERKKISAELHDSLGQDLVVIKNNANMALSNSDPDSKAAGYLRQISDISSSALNNVRAISHNLRPVELDKLGLSVTIKSIIEMVSSSSTINFNSDIDVIDNILDKSNEVNFCRIIQESINNILKHSQASSASVQIKKGEKEIITIIKDNGIGFNTDNLKYDSVHSTFGLTGINERIKMLNGTLKINSSMEKGTELLITIPFSVKP